MGPIQASLQGFFQPSRAFNPGTPSGLHLMTMANIQAHCLRVANIIISGMFAALSVRIHKGDGSLGLLPPILQDYANIWPTLWSPSFGKGGTPRLTTRQRSQRELIAHLRTYLRWQRRKSRCKLTWLMQKPIESRKRCLQSLQFPQDVLQSVRAPCPVSIGAPLCL